MPLHNWNSKMPLHSWDSRNALTQLGPKTCRYTAGTQKMPLHCWDSKASTNRGPFEAKRTLTNRGPESCLTNRTVSKGLCCPISCAVLSACLSGVLVVIRLPSCSCAQLLFFSAALFGQCWWYRLTSSCSSSPVLPPLCSKLWIQGDS